MRRSAWRLFTLTVAVLALGVTGAAAQDRSVLGVFGQYTPRGYRIDRVERNSQAERLRLKPGHYIVVVWGLPIGTIDTGRVTIPEAFAYARKHVNPREVEITIHQQPYGLNDYAFAIVELPRDEVPGNGERALTAKGEKAPKGKEGEPKAKPGLPK